MDFQRDLCYYTQAMGRHYIICYTDLPYDIINIIAEYTEVYREDHLKPYDFGIQLSTFQDEAIEMWMKLQKGQISIVGAPRRYGRTTAIAVYLIKKEIECKENKIQSPPLITVLCTSLMSRHYLEYTYRKLKQQLNEPWMLRDEVYERLMMPWFITEDRDTHYETLIIDDSDCFNPVELGKYTTKSDQVILMFTRDDDVKHTIKSLENHNQSIHPGSRF